MSPQWRREWAVELPIEQDESGEMGQGEVEALSSSCVQTAVTCLVQPGGCECQAAASPLLQEQEGEACSCAPLISHLATMAMVLRKLWFVGKAKQSVILTCLSLLLGTFLFVVFVGLPVKLKGLLGIENIHDYA